MSKLLDKYSESLRLTLSKSKTQLQTKEVEVPEETKLTNIPGLIEKIDNGSKVELVVTAKDYEGQELTATKGEKRFKGTVTEGVAHIFVDEEGWWKVSAKDGYFIEIKTEITHKTTLKSYDLFGVRVKQSESNPKLRIEPLEDLKNLRPITVNTQDGTVDYGDMPDTFLFKAMNHVVLKSIDQSEEIELDPNDYSKKLDGSPAPAAGLDSNYNTFARVDKLYIYEYDQDGYEYFYIANKKVNENYEPIGFYNETGECNSVYMSTFLGCLDDQNRLRSVSDENIESETNYNNFYAASRNTGNDYYMETHAHINLYEIAYLMMFQNDDSQKNLGNGRKISGNKTGIANTKGPISYDTSSMAIKFMHIEDFLCQGSYEEGIIFSNLTTRIKMRPPYSKGDISTYTLVEDASKDTNSAYISASTVSNKWGRIPREVNGSSDLYQCDTWYPGWRENQTLCCVRNRGGIWTRDYNSFTDNMNYYAARLSLIPSN